MRGKAVWGKFFGQWLMEAWCSPTTSTATIRRDPLPRLRYGVTLTARRRCISSCIEVDVTFDCPAYTAWPASAELFAGGHTATIQGFGRNRSPWASDDSAPAHGQAVPSSRS
ncbi:MAG: hypothetical protein ACLUW6_11415 [Coriobacteriaceae bacterium]